MPSPHIQIYDYTFSQNKVCGDEKEKNKKDFLDKKNGEKFHHTDTHIYIFSLLPLALSIYNKQQVRKNAAGRYYGPVLAGFISQENSNVNIVFVPRSCHKLSPGTKKMMSQKRTVCHM
jgi:hypothetical protein